MNIILSDDQAKRLSKHLDDFIFSGMADIAEAINYQIDWSELNSAFKPENFPEEPMCACKKCTKGQNNVEQPF